MRVNKKRNIFTYGNLSTQIRFFFNVSNVKIFNNVPKFNKTLALLEGQEKEWANPVMSLVVTGSAQLVPQEPEFYTCSQCLLLLSDVSCENK